MFTGYKSHTVYRVLQNPCKTVLNPQSSVSSLYGNTELEISV